MLSLRVEIALCLAAASLLGLLCGWMMQRARSRRRLDETVAGWQARYAELERSARQDEENLEERLQLLGQKLRSVETENRSLREAASGEKASLDAARAEAIELNRRQTETQERLQRIISEREREIAVLRARTDPAHAARASAESPSPSAPLAVAEAPAPGARRSAMAGADDDATVALLGSEDRGADHDELMAVIDGFDETIRLDPSTLPREQGGEPGRADARAGRADEAADADEATVALDEETLARVRARAERGG